MKELAICIPVWNRRETIIEAVSSLVCQGDCFDIHVFDNASTDDTVDVVKETFGSRVYLHENNENIGYAKNINRCLSLSNYEWIGILHSDDIHTEDSISTFLRYKRRFPCAGILFSPVHIIDALGKCLHRASSVEHFWRAGKEAVQRCQHQIPCSSTFYNAQAILEHGLFSLEFPYSADEEYNSRLATTFDVVQMDTVVASYRHHGGHLMYSTWAKKDFISNFEAMRVRMDGYLKEHARGESEVKRDVAVMLARQTLPLVAHGHRVVAKRFFRNLWQKSPSAFLKPDLFARFFLCNFPLFSSYLCRKISRSV